MSTIKQTFRLHWPRLKALMSIRGRLALLAIILVTPLMIERVRSLEAMRNENIREASQELVAIAEKGIEAQQMTVRSTESILKAAAYFHTTSIHQSDPCALINASSHLDNEFISNISIVRKDGRIACSTNPSTVGIDISDRNYFQQAKASRDVVISDYLITRAHRQVSVIAAFSVSTVNPDVDDIVLAPIGLGWFNKMAETVRRSPSLSVLLLDGAGRVLAQHPTDVFQTDQPLGDAALIKTIASNDKGLTASSDFGVRRLFAFVHVPGTTGSLVVSIDEDEVTGTINRDIRTAYLQSVFLTLIILLGAWFVSERLVIEPLRVLSSVAQRFGHGDLSVRASHRDLPIDFVPLAKSFDAMAARLSEREGELRAKNNRLSVLATLDPVSGLANRRGFESRIDFEWMRASETGQSLAAMMIDVDHFKMFNDTYGHPEGDTCLRSLGKVLEDLATRNFGFAARYGGEEFLILLPGADLDRAMMLAEQLRQSVVALAIPHRATSNGIVTISIGVAAATPQKDVSAQTLIEAADSGLYVAKNRGRNQIAGHGMVLAVTPDAPDFVV